jgi:phosphate acetyltransferase
MAAAALVENGLADPLLLGTRPLHGLDPECARRLPPERWWTSRADLGRKEIADLIWRRRRHRGMTQGEAYVLAAEPLYQAMALVSLDLAQGVVAGASVATAAVARAALWVLGPAAGASTVSGAFFMFPPDQGGRPLVFADCAVVPEPTTSQLVEIARSTAESFARVLARWPSLAMLSFSTQGSSAHPAAARVAKAAADLKAAQPAWNVVGEVQADAALVPAVAAAKGIDWGAGDTADVLIFPDLGSGNIGSKLVERLGKWRAVGPLLQGLRRPVCDLSRGCSALDVVDAAVLTALLCSESS